MARVAEGWRKHEGPLPKSLESDKNCKPNISYFVAILRFVAIYALFGNLCTKKVLFWVKNSVSGARNALLQKNALSITTSTYNADPTLGDVDWKKNIDGSSSTLNVRQKPRNIN